MAYQKLSIITLILYVSLANGNESTYAEELEHMKTCDIAIHYGYPCETHTVTTHDGYILVMHRIPHGRQVHNITRNRTSDFTSIAFLQHGIVQSSATWVINGLGQSLAFLLADKGFDVWMGNSRGNTYSFKHKDPLITEDDEKFWDFSFTEMARYDLPSMIDYALQITSEKQVNYIGHSQGSTLGFAGFSENPLLASKIRMFISFAPIAYMEHAKGLLRFLSDTSPLTKPILLSMGTKNFPKNNWVTRFIMKRICGGFIGTRLCSSVLFLVCGIGHDNLDSSRIPLYLSHFPSGTSVKNILHFSQLIQTGKFAEYDYGWNGNMHKYLQPYPPEYEIQKIKIPVAYFCGENDWLSTPDDVYGHLLKLPKFKFIQMQENWNNMDSMWGIPAKEQIYDNVVVLLNDPIPT